MAKTKFRHDNEQSSYENGPDGEVVVRTTVNNDTSSPVEVSPSGLLLFNIEYDEITVTYPTSSSEVYTYELAASTVATVTITYTDDTKRNLSTVVRT